jgi:hypothetical protein
MAYGVFDSTDRTNNFAATVIAAQSTCDARCLKAERSDVKNHPWWVVFVDSMGVEGQET